MTETAAPALPARPPAARHWLGLLYVQVLIGMVAGIVLGVAVPGFAVQLKPLADGFIKLIKMLLAPIIFGTILVGIAQMGSLREVGRIGAKALVYFEILSTAALAIGLVVGNLTQPGAGMNVDPGTLDTHAVGAFADRAAHEPGVAGFLLGIIPDSFGSAFTQGSMLQVILLAVLLGVAASGMGERAARVSSGWSTTSPS